jgi:hypothetical protein
MSTAEERKARRHEIINRLHTAIAERAPHLLRPMDADDEIASDALLAAIITGRKNGFTVEELSAIKDLVVDWHEARSNTP